MAILRNRCFLLVAALAAGALGACSTLQVTSDVNSRMSIASCHTYAWAAEVPGAPGSGRAEANPLNAARLHAAIDANMAAKGLQPLTDRAAADCIVGFAVGVRTVVDGFYGAPYGWGWGLGWGYRQRGFVGLGWDEPYVYQEGLIAVDLYEAKSRQPIWHAVVNRDISHLTGNDAESAINAAVAAIFIKFPGSPGSKT